jgi:glycosyltransferase involved in cell wall biosynthesis
MNSKEQQPEIRIDEAYLHVQRALSITQAELDRYRESYFGKAFRACEKMRNLPRKVGAISQRFHQVRKTHGYRHAIALSLSKLTGSAPAVVESLRYEEQSTQIFNDEQLPRLEKQPLVISWIVGGYMPKGGGHRNIFRMAYHLERFGHIVNLYIADTPIDSLTLKKMVCEQMYPIQGTIVRYEGKIAKSDVVVATHWETVKHVQKHESETRTVCYFVQDYEPLFYPMGSEHLLAAETYTRGYFHVCSGEWAAKTIAKRHGAKAGHFQFPIDKSIYQFKNRKRETGQIVFFAKPEMPRRCFELGVAALEELYKINKDIKIIMYGSPEAKKFAYGFPVTVKAFVATLAELAEIYNTSEVGLAFSTTNPSLVPYEMMACGLPIVDLMTEDSEANYNNRFDIALLSTPSPKFIAQSINQLLQDRQDWTSRRDRGIEFTSTFPSEAEAARTVENLIATAYVDATGAGRGAE